MSIYSYHPASDTTKLDRLIKELGEWRESLQAAQEAEQSQKRWREHCYSDRATLGDLEYQSFATENDYAKDIAECEREIERLDAEIAMVANGEA